MTVEAAQAASPVPEAAAASRSRRRTRRRPRSAAAEPDGSLDVCGRERSLLMRTRERCSAVQQLLADGALLAEIYRHLELDRTTVCRFARATSLDELLVKAATGPVCLTVTRST